MGIRKITFDNGDIVLAKDQAILYDLLLKQQTKTLLPNGETIYQNSTGFLIQNESEKLKYTDKITVYGLEFIFNSQLYLSICGRIIKLEKDTKYFFDWNDIKNNETYYVVIKIDLSKEAKIINGKLKEFGSPVEVKLINTKEILTQDNLNQKSNDGIYEFPLISFIKKYNPDNSWEIKTKNESTYLLPLLMESNSNPSKLLTITQKIQEEKENIENNLTNLKYRKIKELKDLEEYILGRDIKNWKLIDNSKENLSHEFHTPLNNKWYIMIYGGSHKLIAMTKRDQLGKLAVYDSGVYTKIFFGDVQYFNIQNISIYRWDGLNKPNMPKIDNSGKIIDWNGINIIT